MDFQLQQLEKYNDDRGQLIVFLQRRELNKKIREFGQIYFVTFDKANIIRGNHYHKRWREWFGIISGQLRVHLKDLNTGEEKKLILNGNSNKYNRLEIGPKIAHVFQNISKTAALLNYTDKEWTKGDTFKYKLL